MLSIHCLAGILSGWQLSGQTLHAFLGIAPKLGLAVALPVL